MHTTLVSMDIQKFNRETAAKSSEEVLDYLVAYYDRVASGSEEKGWEVVKTMGDCVLIDCGQVMSSRVESALIGFHESVRRDFPVETRYRACDVEKRELSFGRYRCNDVFGPDVNGLFLKDGQTEVLSD